MIRDDLEDVWSAHVRQVTDEEINQAVDAAGLGEVVCRECAGTFGQITAQHLQTHDMSLKEYQAAHPEAPIYPRATARQPGREPGFTHDEETRQKIGERARENHERGVYE